MRACVSINKKVTSFVPRKQTKEQKKRRRRHRRPEWNLTVLWLCSFWSKSFKKRERERERERERDADLFFGFFIFLQKEPDEGKREAVQHFLHIKKSEQPWLTYSTREVIRNKSALTSGK